MPLNMKVYLCTDTNLLDANEQFLPAGKYYFIIKSFIDNNVKGKIINNGSKIPYEFRFFTFMTMMAKAQSYLARRANIRNKNMPNYDSPVNLPKPKFLLKKKILKKLKEECTICLEDKLDCTACKKRLSCGHEFHLDCIKDWIKINKSCPNCRKKINSLD